MTDEEVQELISNIQSDDPSRQNKAVEDLLHILIIYKHRFYSGRYPLPPEDVEVIINLVVFRLFRLIRDGFNKFFGSQAFLNYVYTAFRNQIVDEARRQQRQRAVSLNDLLSAGWDIADEPEKSIEDEHAVFQRLISTAGLNEKEKTVLELLANNYRVSEIAQRMNLQAAAVSRLVYTARRKLAAARQETRTASNTDKKALDTHVRSHK